MFQRIFAENIIFMKKITMLASTLFLMTGLIAQTNWKVDNSHSKLGFSVVHMMVSETDGKFRLYDGKVTSKTETDFNGATVEFSVDVSSINTEDEKRDGHLKSEDFFNAAKYPKMVFKSTSMKAGKTKGTYVIEGDLTIKDVTKKVQLTATTSGKVVKDPYGLTRTGFKVTGKINRVEFGLKWNAVLEAGGVAVSEEVTLECNIELIKS